MSRTVYLHIGTAKSGTSYLQRALFRNRELLRARGCLYPRRPRAHYFGSMDLRKARVVNQYPAASGMWSRIAEDVNHFDGNAVISHETLALTSMPQLERAVSSFEQSQVRIVITCRDLGRLLPAAWQERMKNRYTVAYDEYLRGIFTSWDEGNQASGRSGFWGLQDLVSIGERWASAVGAANVRLVTVPSSDGGNDELWQRFVEAADLPAANYDLDIPNTNPSLGAAEAEVLRRLNPLLSEGVSWRDYERRVKGELVRRALSRNRRGGSLTVPEKWRDRAEAVAQQMIDHLRDSGYTVVGDLEDLRPSFRDDGALPEEFDNASLLDAALYALAGVGERDPKEDRSGPSPRRSPPEVSHAESAKDASDVLCAGSGGQQHPAGNQ